MSIIIIQNTHKKRKNISRHLVNCTANVSRFIIYLLNAMVTAAAVSQALSQTQQHNTPPKMDPQQLFARLAIAETCRVHVLEYSCS